MLAASSIVGNYRVLEVIGHGGFAVVYKAEDQRLGRQVALKVLHVEELLPERQQQERIARFRREATAAASLNHPNIVTIYEIGDSEGMRYIAMELLEGETLRARLESRRTLSPSEALPIIEQLGAALEHAHQNNLIHRDVKPDNVFLLPDGRVKLTDFGIARGMNSVGMTQIGSFVGSPAYMSPEQIAGEKLDHRADIFSLGITLYETLSGRRPFESDTLALAVHNICFTAPAPLTNLPQSIQKVLARALEKEPARRYQSTGEFVAAFRAAVASAQSQPEPSTDTGSAQEKTLALPARSAEELAQEMAATTEETSREPPPARLAPSTSLTPLRQRVREGSEAFEFDALIEGVSTLSEKAEDSPQEGDQTMQPRSPGRIPLLLGALGLVIVLAVIGVYAFRARSDFASATTGESFPTNTGAGGISPVRFRLPADPTTPGVGAQAQAPVFILSDFERTQGAWQPDKRLPACRDAFVQRVRDRAQQGAYWLKMDRLAFSPGFASQAALVVRPDSSDLSRHGPTISAAIFLPQNAPQGMQAALGIEDPQGRLHRQDGSVMLLPGKWTIVRWEAGDLLKNVQQVAVLLSASGKTYNGYVGLDNVQLREETTAPVITNLKATTAPDGSVRVSGNGRFMIRLAPVVCEPDWQFATPSPTVKFQMTPRAVNQRTLEISVEATPQKETRARALAVEALLPKSLYGSAHIDLSTSGTSPATHPLLLSAEVEQVHVAGDFPNGFTLKPDSPTLILVCDDVVATPFVFSADRPLQSVNLAGTFNGWNTTATPLTQSADGRTWSVTVPMTPGEQLYKFVLNGSEWITDPKAVKNQPDPDGNINSVRYVVRPSGSIAEPAFRLWVALAGRTDGTPVTLEAGKTLRKSFRLTFNQPFKNALARARR